MNRKALISLCVLGIALGGVFSTERGHADSATPGSLFDELVRSNGGNVPFPVATLRDYLPKFAEQYSTPGRSPLQSVAFLIPKGRSRQAPHTGFADPRVLLATGPADNEDGGRPSIRNFADRLFIGYSKLSSELEIISWDNRKGRYEFQLVSDYRPGGAMRLNTPNRGRCLDCHQDGVPIFSAGPWSESNMNVADSPLGPSRISSRIQEAIHASTYEGIPVDAVGPDGVSRPSRASQLDLMVRSASQLQLARTVAKSACGANVSCRSELLRRVQRLARMGFYNFDTTGGGSDGISEDMQPASLKLFQDLLAQTWPTQGFGVTSSVLPDRDPLVEGDLTPEEAPDTSRAIDSPLKISPDLRAPRMTLLMGLEGLGFYFKDLPTLSLCGDTQFDQLLRSPQMQPMLMQWPLDAAGSDDLNGAADLREQVLGLIRTQCGG